MPRLQIPTDGGDKVRDRLVVEVVAEADKFITAIPARGEAGDGVVQQAFAHGAQRRIPLHMAIGVVILLQTVHIKHDDAQCAAGGVGGVLLNQLLQIPPGIDPGQLV